jgi:glycerol-3-phosphate acyltransferase PlsY
MLSGLLLGLAAILIGYLLGSIPTAYIVVRFRKGVDIRNIDVGNVGAAAVFRQVGIPAGAFVALVDASKGVAAILIARALGVSEPWVLGAGLAAVLGHSFPIYIGFRGGQGSATLMGIFFILAPQAMAVMIVLMGIAICFTRRVFPMLCITFLFLPLLIWIFDGSVMLILYSVVIIIFLAYRNRHGLKELLTNAGTPFNKRQS